MHLESRLSRDKGGEDVRLLEGGHAHRVGDYLGRLLLRNLRHRRDGDLDLSEKVVKLFKRKDKLQ